MKIDLRLPIAVLAAIALLTLAPVSAQTSAPVSVLYAGSLVTPMEGPIKTALAAQGIDFQGQGAGSKMLANLISAGTKTPDIFISVDPKLVLGLGVEGCQRLDVCRHQPRHRLVERFQARGVVPERCRRKDHRAASIANTRPRHRPHRSETRSQRRLHDTSDDDARWCRRRKSEFSAKIENAAQIFPEEDLLARIDTGQADVGFFYKTEAVARDLHFVPLPGAASLSDKITYTLAVMNNAPHPDQAKAFAAFILTGDGKSILQKAGIEYLAAPKSIVP